MLLLNDALELLKAVRSELSTARKGQIDTLLTKVGESRASDREIEAARDIHGTTDIEIDEGALTSATEDPQGVWVSAWVWVGEDEL